MSDLNQKIKEVIIKALELEDITPADIVDDAPLFGEGENSLGLDSIEEALCLRQRPGRLHFCQLP